MQRRPKIRFHKKVTSREPQPTTVSLRFKYVFCTTRAMADASTVVSFAQSSDVFFYIIIERGKIGPPSKGGTFIQKPRAYFCCESTSITGFATSTMPEKSDEK